MKWPSAAFLGLVSALLFTASSADAGIVGSYTGGHGDIGVKYVNNELVLRYEFGSSAIINGSPLGAVTQFAPDEIITEAGPSSYQPVTGTSAESYFPTSTGGYFFGINNSTTEPFLGLSAGDPTLIGGDWDRPSGSQGLITFEITGVNYTGAAASPQFLYYAPTFAGVDTIYDHLHGNASYPQLPFPIGVHGHFGFGFSHPGTYDVTFTASGTHLIDGFKSGNGTFTFNVGPGQGGHPVPEPGSLLLGGIGLGLMTCFRSRRASKSA